MSTVPIPSQLPQDLKENSGRFDEVMTSDEHYYTDRFGVRRWTIAGFQYTAEEAIRNYGYITLKSFQLGAPLPNNELTLPNQVLQDETNGEYYRWDGDFPKVVPPGSTPSSTGGEGAGAWVSVGDASLRSDLASTNGDSLVGLSPGGKLSDIVIPISDVSMISNMEFHDGLSYRLASWRPISAPITNSYGGGEFYYSASMPRNLHNGGTIIDVSVPYSSVESYLSGTGTAGGNGCLVRKGTETEFLMSWFGAVPNTETVPSTASAQKCIDEAFKYLKPSLIDFSIITEKPLVITRASTLRGLSKYKCFIFKITDTKSGLANMQAPTDSGGASVSYDVDAVIIIKPQNDGEYAAWVNLEDFSVEKNNSPANIPMPLESYGIYAPYMNMSQISRCQAYKVGYAIYSYNMFMTQVNDWRGHVVNHNIYVIEGGTSLVFNNVWAVDIYDTAYYFKNVGYSNLLLSVDRCYRSDITDELIYPYIFEGCVNTNALLSLEETEGCGIIQVSGSSTLRSNLKITMYAASGVRQHTTTVPKPAVNIGGSDVTFENTNIKFHPGSTGNIAPMFVHDSNITAINTDYFRDNFFSSDDDVSKMIYIGSALSVRGKSGGSAIEATLGTDLGLQGDYDRGGKIKFFGVNGALYGTLFANSSGNLLWKANGTPTTNVDGVKLN